MNYDRKVSWEVQTGTSKASLSRLIHALVLCGGELRSNYVMAGALIAIIKLAPEKLDRFKLLAKPEEARYRSPTRFDNGTLRNLFEDPEMEISARTEPRVGAVIWKKDDQITVVVVSDQAHANRVLAERGWDVMNCTFLTEKIDLHITPPSRGF